MDDDDLPRVEDGPPEEKVNIYSVPPFSYYVVPKGDDPPEDKLLCTDSNANKEHSKTKPLMADKAYVPRAEMQPLPPQYVGRRLEQQRYVTLMNKPYRVPLWDQACLKYIFGGMFEGSIDIMEFFSLSKMAIMIVVNCSTVAINVFQDTASMEYLKWVMVMAKVVFCIEFGVVYFLLFFMLCVILEAAIRDNIGTNLAGDIAVLANKISTFSALRVVSIVSPTYAMNKILPMAQNAFGLVDYIKILVCLLLWICACGLAAAAVVMKVTQIDFASTKSIRDWSLTEVIQLIGLTMNLARVDDSYFTETRVLLDAVHRHFCRPGRPKDGLNRTECLYTRVCDLFGISRYSKYEYFDVIFNYHFECDHPQTKLTTRMKLRKMLNYLAFIFRMDNTVIRRFLQMIQSPLPFYQMGRDTFMISFKERDTLGMEIALWRSDPDSVPTQMFGRKHEDQFNLTYECEECRHMWDAENLGHIDPNASSEKRFCEVVLNAGLTPP